MPKKSLCLILIMCLGGLTVQAADSDWTGFRGSNSDGLTTEKTTITPDMGLEVAWRHQIGTGFSSPVTVGNHTIIAYADKKNDIIAALDVKTGKEKWRYIIGPIFDAPDPSEDGPLATPYLANGKVYMFTSTGHLLALNASNGKEEWRKDLKEEYGLKQPHFGFTSSPVLVSGVLISGMGADEGHAYGGFDPKTGKNLWTYGTGSLDYQSPVYANIHGEDQVIVATKKTLAGLNPKTGEARWEYAVDNGGGSDSPVSLGDNRIFAPYKRGNNHAIQISKDGSAMKAEMMWETRAFSFATAYQGHVYGLAGKILTCLRIEDGERVWRSRAPGEGYLMLLNDHLIASTRNGEIHVAKATTDGWNASASLKLFEGNNWSPPTYANGHLLVRNGKEVVALKFKKSEAPITLNQEFGKAPGTKFASWLDKLAASNNKSAEVKGFMDAQKSFPVIEDNRWVHVVYNGKVEDVAIGGDPGPERPMNHVEGTDFYYHSFEITPDAHAMYYLNVDYQGPKPDPKAVAHKHAPERYTEVRMPESRMSPMAEKELGKADSFEWDSKIYEKKRKIDVWLPAGYDKSKSYPTLYVLKGGGAFGDGKLPATIDAMTGKQIEPVITVYMNHERQWEISDYRDVIVQAIVEELVPTIDARYSTIKDAKSRAVVGHENGTLAALQAGWKHGSVFGKVAGISNSLRDQDFEKLKEATAAMGNPGFELYFDWGRFGREKGWADNNAELFKMLKGMGVKAQGGPVNQGHSWSSWRTRHAAMLSALFPLNTN